MDCRSQIASIMELLANAAVAEMCKVVDDRYAVVHLEMSRNQQENESLRKKIQVLEQQIARYRAERAKAAEGSAAVSRPVRLRRRQSADAPAGPSLQGRTRFLNRDPGTQQFVQKTHPVSLDQDPDHKSAEPEEEAKLLIIKVEGTMETGTTNHEASGDTATRGGGVYSATSLPAAATYARQHGETEGQGCPGSTSSAQHQEEKMSEVKGVTPEKRSPAWMPLGWQETSQTKDRERPSCATRTAEVGAGEASFSRVKTNPASGFPTVSRRPQCDMNQAYPVTRLDTTEMKSSPCAAEDSCGGDDGAEEVTPLIGQDDTSGRPQYEPLLCIQISEPPSDVMFEGNATYSLSAFNNPLDSMAAVDSQQTQHSWSGIQPMDNGHSSQNHHYQASSNRKQESWSAQWQQSCLPYACSFCSRRYAHLSKLRLHERFHRGEKPHQCIQCGKSFVQACSLKRHQMVHTGEKPFPCPHCGKQFSTSTNLKVHQSVHTGEKSFHCSKCGKNFSFLSNLIKHRALHTARQSKSPRDRSASETPV